MVACRIIVSAPVPFLWTLDFGFGTWIWELDLGVGFGTWIWDLNLGLDLGLDFGLTIFYYIYIKATIATISFEIMDLYIQSFIGDMMTL